MPKHLDDRRRLLKNLGAAGLAGAGLLGGARAATQAAAYPSKTVRFVNSFPPGGPSDILARSLAEKLQTALGATFIVENKPGASGNIGSDFVAKSEPDGYTVLFTIDTVVTINPAVYASMPFQPSDLKPLMILASSGLLVAANARRGIKTLPQLIARGKREPLNFSSAGAGSPGNMAMAILATETGVQANGIPYKGNTPAVLAVVSGEVDAGILATPGLLPHVQAGSVDALATTSATRSPLLPDVPTVAELGLPGLGFEVLYLAMVPAATPQPVLERLQHAMAQALAQPDIEKRLQTLDMTRLALTGEPAAKRLADDRARYTRVVRATGMKVD